MSTEKKTTDAAKEEAVTNEQLMKMVRALQESNDKLAAKVNEQTTREAGQVDYYHCNACGVRLKQGERCKIHPDEVVMGVGVVFNPNENTVRMGAVTKS